MNESKNRINYYPNFKVFESEHFRKQVSLLTFTLSVTEWCV